MSPPRILNNILSMFPTYLRSEQYFFRNSYLFVLDVVLQLAQIMQCDGTAG